jgi:hypothetical protein
MRGPEVVHSGTFHLWFPILYKKQTGWDLRVTSSPGPGRLDERGPRDLRGPAAGAAAAGPISEPLTSGGRAHRALPCSHYILLNRA